MNRPLTLLALLPLLTSCALVQAPVRLVGGAARVTRAAVTAPGKAYDRHQKRKEAERRSNQAKDRAARGSGGNLGGSSSSFGSSPSLGGATSFGESPTLGDGIPIDGRSPVVPDTRVDPGSAADPPLPDFGE